MTRIAFKNLCLHPALSAGLAVATLVILPRYGSLAMASGAAALLTLYLLAAPDPFRSRNGSLRPALGLASGLWLAAAGVAWATLGVSG